MRRRILKKIVYHGRDILHSSNMQQTKTYLQHGSVSCYQHSCAVAYLSVLISEQLHIRCDQRSMIRGALLHDYYLYDWHIKDQSRPLHGFAHAAFALRNARRDFIINEIEADIIKRHMFPLNITPPSRRESVIVCIADKLCALRETFWKKPYQTS